MRTQMKLFVFLVTVLAVIKSERISLIGSHFIPVESNYRVFLSTHNLGSDSKINVTLFNKEYARSVYLDSFDENTFKEIELELPERRSKDYTLRILSNSNNQCRFQSAKIINLKYNPITFIYLDKPIYKPGDTMKFRVFLLGQDLRPYPDNLKVEINIFDSNNVAIHTITDEKARKFGLLENSFTIPDTQTFGNWKIEVQTNRKKSKEFKVQPQNEGNFDVFLNMSDNIAFDDREFTMTILTRPENDKVFDGSAKISVKGKYWESNQYEMNEFVKTVQLLGNKNDISIKIKEDLGIIAPNDDMNLILDIEVLENSSQNIIKVKKEVRMKHEGRSIIQVVRKKYFKPGFKFPIKVRVRVMNGKPDNSLHKLKMTIEYKTKDGITKERKVSEANLKNGETSTVLTPAADTDKIRIQLEIGGSTLVENVSKFSTYDIDEYMQVSFVNKSSTVGDTIQLQAQTTGEIEILNLLIFGTNGLIHNEEFPDAIGKDIYTFKFQLTEEMKPEIRGLVFYIRPSDGVMVYDDFALSLGFGIDNSLEISAPTQAKPNEKIEVTVKSERGSLILLTGIDQNAELFNNDNEISRTDIYSELTYYLNFSVANVHDYKFEKVNNFVLEPIQKGTKCGPKQPTSTQNPEINEVKRWTQKYFPNIWFDQVFEMKSGTHTVELTVPNAIKTWRIYGVSVHPSKGFSVVKKQPEITVKGDFVINIRAPTNVKEEEVFKVDVSAISLVAGYLQPNIEVEVINGFIVNEKKEEHSGKICHHFHTHSQRFLEISKQLESEKRTSIGSFFIKSSWNEEIQIIAKSWFGGVTYESVKKIKVKRQEQESKNNFDIKAEVDALQNNNAKIILNTKMESSAYSGSGLVMEVELPSGYRYVSYDDADNIRNVKYNTNQNLLKFNLNGMEAYRNYRNSINILKVFDVYENQKLTIKIYGANRSDQSSVFSYSYDVNSKACKEVAKAKECSFTKFWNCVG